MPKSEVADRSVRWTLGFVSVLGIVVCTSAEARSIKISACVVMDVLTP